MNYLKVNDIFESISGEAGFFPQGSVCTFIRLQGCNLKCRWCDTPDTQSCSKESRYKFWLPKNLVEHCSLYSTKRVLITGGEPLVQREGLLELIQELSKRNFEIQIETNGSLPLIDILPIPYWIVDVKPPSSGYRRGIDPKFIADLGVAVNFVQLKFAVLNRQDILFAIEQMKKKHLPPAKFIVSPVEGEVAGKTWYPQVIEIFRKEAPELIENIVFSLQLHKIVKMS